MTTTFGTDSNNDLYLGDDGNLVVLTGLAAIIAACETASKAQLGEMVLATALGIPNFQTIWVGTPNISLWENSLRATLEAVPGVLQVSNLTVRVQDNILSYVATISTEFGEGQLNA